MGATHAVSSLSFKDKRLIPIFHTESVVPSLLHHICNDLRTLIGASPLLLSRYLEVLEKNPWLHSICFELAS